MKIALTGVAASCLLFVGCSQSDTAHAKSEARDAGKDIQRDLKKAGQEIKKDLHEAGREIKKGANEIKRDVNDKK